MHLAGTREIIYSAWGIYKFSYLLEVIFTYWLFFPII